MSTLFLELDDSGAYRGRSRDLIVSVRLNGQEVHVSGRTEEGEPVFDWAAVDVSAAMAKLADQEEVLRVVAYDPTTDSSQVHCSQALAPPLPPAEAADGVVALPPFPGLQGAAWARAEGYVQLRVTDIASVVYLRIGRIGGSLVVDAAGVAWAVALEPGAVLMRVALVDDEAAYRLGALR